MRSPQFPSRGDRFGLQERHTYDCHPTVTVEPDTGREEPPVTAEQIIAQIDAWLEEYAWRLDDTAIDFALDIRRSVVELEETMTFAELGAA
jgi:hypothetical protein